MDGVGGGSNHTAEDFMARQDLSWTQRIFRVIGKKGIQRKKDRSMVPELDTCLRCALA